MHVIRLRKPWTRTLDDAGMACRVDVPDETIAATDGSWVVARYSRRFNRPSRLHDARVYLRIAGWQGEMTSLSLNAMQIPLNVADRLIQVDVTSLLQPHNELIVVLSGTDQTPARLSGEVTLGIEDRSVT